MAVVMKSSNFELLTFTRDSNEDLTEFLSLTKDDLHVATNVSQSKNIAQQMWQGEYLKANLKLS